VGQFDKEADGTFLSTLSFVATEDKIYGLEYVYNPSPTNNLLVYDRGTGMTQIVPLMLPSTISGDERGIVSLTRDGNNLIGILSENVLMSGSTKHMISIDLQDYSITELGITFTIDRPTSMLKLDSQVLIPTWGEGFLIVDLTNSSVNILNGISLSSRLAQINDTEFGIMLGDPNFANGVRPEVFNLATLTVTDDPSTDLYGIQTIFGPTIFHDGTYLNLITSGILHMGILKTDFETNQSTVVEVNSTTVPGNMIILDIVD
jgi:hypothetical protein